MFDGWMLSTFHKRNIEWCYPSDDIAGRGAIYEIGIGYHLASEMAALKEQVAKALAGREQG